MRLNTKKLNSNSVWKFLVNLIGNACGCAALLQRVLLFFSFYAIFETLRISGSQTCESCPGRLAIFQNNQSG